MKTQRFFLTFCEQDIILLQVVDYAMYFVRISLIIIVVFLQICEMVKFNS